MIKSTSKDIPTTSRSARSLYAGGFGNAPLSRRCPIGQDCQVVASGSVDQSYRNPKSGSVLFSVNGSDKQQGISVLLNGAPVPAAKSGQSLKFGYWNREDVPVYSFRRDDVDTVFIGKVPYFEAPRGASVELLGETPNGTPVIFVKDRSVKDRSGGCSLQVGDKKRSFKSPVFGCRYLSGDVDHLRVIVSDERGQHLVEGSKTTLSARNIDICGHSPQGEVTMITRTDGWKNPFDRSLKIGANFLEYAKACSKLNYLGEDSRGPVVHVISDSGEQLYSGGIPLTPHGSSRAFNYFGELSGRPIFTSHKSPSGYARLHFGGEIIVDSRGPKTIHHIGCQGNNRPVFCVMPHDATKTPSIVGFVGDDVIGVVKITDPDQVSAYLLHSSMRAKRMPICPPVAGKKEIKWWASSDAAKFELDLVKHWNDLSVSVSEIIRASTDEWLQAHGFKEVKHLHNRELKRTTFDGNTRFEVCVSARGQAHLYRGPKEVPLTRSFDEIIPLGVAVSGEVIYAGGFMGNFAIYRGNHPISGKRIFSSVAPFAKLPTGEFLVRGVLKRSGKPLVISVPA